MSKLRIGVIGLGIGRHHISEYRTHPEAEVVAVAGTDSQRVSEAAKELGVPRSYTNVEEMIEKEELNVVSVCSPNKFHAEHTCLALDAGAHVLCEKPMAVNVKDAQKMRDTAQRAKRRLMINYSYRFTPEVFALKKEMECGTLGEVYYGRTLWHRRRGAPGLETGSFGGTGGGRGVWFLNKELAGGGPLIDLGVHRIDLAMWLMGYPEVESVFGRTFNKLALPRAKECGVDYTVEDMAVGLINFKNGASLSVEASWLGNIKREEWMETRLWGTEGGAIHKNIKEGYSFEAQVYRECRGVQQNISLINAPAPHSAMYSFVDAIANDTPNSASAAEGVALMEILEGLYSSSESGDVIRFH